MVGVTGAIDKLLVDGRYLLCVGPVLLPLHRFRKVGRKTLELECIGPVFAVQQRYLAVLDAVCATAYTFGNDKARVIRNRIRVGAVMQRPYWLKVMPPS